MPKSRDSLWIVAYDVTEDKEREKVATVLEGYGIRAQKSVFECRLTVGMRRRLEGDLVRLEVKTGFITLYPCGAGRKPIYVGCGCAAAEASVGEVPQPTPVDFTERHGEAAWIV